MNYEINKIDLGNGIIIYAPDIAKSIIKEIWEDKIYTREYSIEKGDTVIDIGSNIGIFSLYAAYCGADVYSFEPHPETFDILQRNVIASKLDNKIKVFNCAINDNDGYVDLQIPVSEKIYTLGSATISEEVKDDIEKKQDINYKTIMIKCISLGSFLNENIQQHKMIDLLKIDCEGAEYNILKGLELQNAKFIKNIAMETHVGYSEKAMVSLLNEQGFIVERYEKRSGYFKTGYCYARHQIDGAYNKKIEKKPIGILNVDDKCFVSQEIEIRSDDSFILNDTSSPPIFNWYIDDKKVDNVNGCFKYSFLEPGLHYVKSIISNNTLTDSIEEKIIVFKSDYFNVQNEVYLNCECEKAKFTVQKHMTFRIPKDSLPKNWKCESINVLIMVLNQHIELVKPVLESNGTEHKLPYYCNEIEITSVNSNVDIIFKLTLQHEADIEIKWWPKQCSIYQPNANQDGNCYVLGNISSEMNFVIQGKNNFLIKKENFPKEWYPKCFKVGIATIPKNGEYTLLNGFFEHDGGSFALDDYYKEIIMERVDISCDIEFYINVKEKNSIKVAWWAE
jgi:FkbM family methyltransferase